jgi:hypothetical protein
VSGPFPTALVQTDQGWQPPFPIPPGANIATASGVIDPAGPTVTIQNKTANILSISANPGAGTITVQFENGFDADGIYFAAAIVFPGGLIVPGTTTVLFLPATQTTDQTVFQATGFPGTGPWNFAVFAIGS